MGEEKPFQFVHDHIHNKSAPKVYIKTSNSVDLAQSTEERRLFQFGIILGKTEFSKASCIRGTCNIGNFVMSEFVSVLVQGSDIISLTTDTVLESIL